MCFGQSTSMQTKASVRRRKGKDRRYKQNRGTLGPTHRRGARGVASGGDGRRQGDLPVPEQRPEILEIRSRESHAPSSKADIAYRLIRDWCGHRAREISGIPDANIFIPTPPDYFLMANWQWELARCFTKAENCAVFEPRTLEDLNNIVPPDKWRFSSSHAPALLLFLQQNIDFVNAEYARLHPSNDLGSRPLEGDESTLNCPSKQPRDSSNSTENTQDGIESEASRRYRLALAAALQHQHERDQDSSSSTENTRDGIESETLRRNRLALAAALQRQHEREKEQVAQKSAAGVGDIDH